MTSVTEAQRDISGLIVRAAEHPQLIVRHNKPAAVIVGIKDFNAMQQRISKLEEMIDHVLLFVEIQARSEHTEGEVTLEELAKEYGL